MKLIEAVVNAANRRLDRMFPAYFPEAKHNYYKDFGWPERLSFAQFHGAYRRNGLASAGVEKTILKTWQDIPEIKSGDGTEETTADADVRARFEDIGLWQALAEADRRAFVAGWSGVIIRFADSKGFDQPVDRVPGGLDGIVELIPAWGGEGAQLEVSDWDEDPKSERYGKPKMFGFNEAAVSKTKSEIRQFSVHPDRVLIWSKDGSIHCRSDLEPGFNDLIDAEKVKGAGGEGFYKAARGNPVLEADKDLKLEEMARSMGVDVSELADTMNEQVEDFQRGFDKLLMVQGMQAKTLPVNLPNGVSHFEAPVQSFAASILCPVKILLGSQTGERASTEDANEWNLVNNARRVNFAKPRIRALINRFVEFSIMADVDWKIEWADLTDDSKDKKIERAEKMAKINKTQGDDIVWEATEIRKAAGDSEDVPTSLSRSGAEE